MEVYIRDILVYAKSIEKFIKELRVKLYSLADFKGIDSINIYTVLTY